MTKTITLTNEQAITLRVFLSLTTHYRKRELETCRKFSTELKDDGTLMFPYVVDSVNFWEDVDITIDEILKII